MAQQELLERFRRARPNGIFLDFDGTLSEIVARPDQARPIPEARTILADLAGRHNLVAVVSGRRTDEVRALIESTEIEVFGHYGIIESASEGVRSPEVLSRVHEVAGSVPGAWVEDKGASLAVHYRAAADPAAAQGRLRPVLQAIADARGLTILPGKMVLELAPADTPGKGSVILREARARNLAGCFFAGDDRADLAGFAALDELKADGTVTVKVAVKSEETPQELIDEADIVVEGPSGLLELLGRL
jgi:trehalose 6-phosphate phosphatase